MENCRRRGSPACAAFGSAPAPALRGADLGRWSGAAMMGGGQENRLPTYRCFLETWSHLPPLTPQLLRYPGVVWGHFGVQGCSEVGGSYLCLTSGLGQAQLHRAAPEQDNDADELLCLH